MKKIIISMFIFLIILNFVSALDCQYKEKVIDFTETKFLPFDKDGNQLKEVIIELNENWNQPAKIINPNSEKINLTLKININIKSVTWCNGYSHPLDFILTKEADIPSNSFIELPVEKPVKNFYCNDFRWTEPYEIQYNSNEAIEVILTEIEHKKEICKICHNGKQCLDDGVSCEVNNECGFGICNPAKKCGEFSGICPEGQILNDEKNLCVNSFFTNFKKNMLWIFGIIFATFFGGIYIWKKVEEAKEQRRINRALRKYNHICPDKLEYDKKSGYIVFKDSKDLYHVWRYKTLLKEQGKTLPNNVSVHHIDRNKLHCDLENLIAIKKEKHDVKWHKFNHNLIKEGNWNSGIQQLKEQLKWKDSDFPEHIQKEIKKRRYKELGKKVISFI